MEITTHGAQTGSVGLIEFEVPPTRLSAERTAEGFKILIPVSVTMPRPSSSSTTPMLRDLRGTVSATGSSGTAVEIGRFVCESSYKAAVKKAPAMLDWRGTLPALAFYERLRQGKPPKFQINLTGDIYSIIQERGQADRLYYTPEPFGGAEQVIYPAEAWADVLRRLRVTDIIMIEIPLPCDPPSGWDRVWAEVLNAHSELQRGGETAWRGCATAVRIALEEWRKIEKDIELDPAKTPLRQRSKHERFDDLRHYLKNYADQPQHSAIEEWSREEASLMLAGVSALLAVRKP